MIEQVQSNKHIYYNIYTLALPTYIEIERACIFNNDIMWKWEWNEMIFK